MPRSSASSELREPPESRPPHRWRKLATDGERQFPHLILSKIAADATCFLDVKPAHHALRGNRAAVRREADQLPLVTGRLVAQSPGEAAIEQAEAVRILAS